MRNEVVVVAILLFVSLIFTPFAYAAVYSGSGDCGSTVTEDSTLSGDIATCNALQSGLIIGASNVVLDCQGNSIVGSLGPRAIDITGGYQNVSIIDCQIRGWDIGFDLTSTVNLSIRGGSVHNISTEAIIATNSNNSEVINFALWNVSNQAVELVSASSHWTFDNVTIYEAQEAILLDTATNVTIKNSNLSAEINVDGSSAAENHIIHSNYLQDADNTMIALDGSTDGVQIYNNFFRNYNSLEDVSGSNAWNITLQDEQALGINSILNQSSNVCGNYYGDLVGVNDTNDDGVIDQGNKSIAGAGGNFDVCPLASGYLFDENSSYSLNSTFTDNNAMLDESYHFTKQNITFYNGSSALIFEAFFNQTVNLTLAQIQISGEKVAVNLTLAEGINQTRHTFYVNNSNDGNGVVVCPDATTHQETNDDCENAILFTKDNVTNIDSINGITVSLVDPTRYRIDNLNGTGVATSGNASLTIWDEVEDDGSPKSGFTRYVDEQVQFFVNYSDSSSGPITSAVCTINYEDSTGNLMSYNATSSFYEYNRTFSSSGSKNWNASCAKTGIATLNATDTVEIVTVPGSECGIISTNATLTGDLVSNGTCFTINTSNVVLDGAGFTITGNTTGYGIITNDVANVTIKNFANISNYTNAIYLNASSAYYANITVFNNTLTSSTSSASDPLFIRNAENNTISANTVSLNSSGAYGIIVSMGSDTAIESNTIDVMRGAAGVLVTLSSNNVSLENNNVTTLQSSSDGFYLTSGAQTNVTANNISTQGNSANAIVVNQGATSTFISQNVLSTQGSLASAIYLDEATLLSSQDNIITANDQTAYALSLQNEASLNVFLNENITSTGPQIYAYNVSNNTFTNLSLNNFTHSIFELRNLTFQINTTGPQDTQGKSNISRYFELANLSAQSTYQGNISYLGVTLSDHFDESSLRVYNHNGSEWLVDASGSVDITSKVVSTGDLSPNGGTAFGILGDVANNVSNLTTPILSPILLNTSSDIIANTTYLDADNDTATITFEWYVDGVLTFTQTNLSVVNGTALESTFASSNYTKNEVVQVNITANDGYNTTISNSSFHTVVNTLPLITTTVTQIQRNTSELFFFDFNATDPDVIDGVDVLNWTDNATLFDINQTTGIINFTPNESQVGVFDINITVNDTTAPSARNSTVFTFTINDTLAPRISFIAPTTAATTLDQTSITANVSVTEANIDTINITLYNSTGELINSTSGSTSPLSINFTGLAYGTYYLNATANDTYTNLNTTSTRTIVLSTNSTPQLSSPSLIPSTLYTNTSVTATTLYTDNENKSSTVTFYWQVDGVELFNQTNHSIFNLTSVTSTLGSSNFTKNQTINVTIQVNDSLSFGTNVTNESFSQNSAPYNSTVISAVSINTGTSTTLNLSTYFTDADNDELNFSITNISIVNMSFSNLTKILSITSLATGSGQVFVNATDGENTSLSNNFTITVSAPSSGSSSSGGSSGGGGPARNITCREDSDCATQTSYYCSDNGWYEETIVSVCENPGKFSSSCVEQEPTSQLVEQCQDMCTLSGCREQTTTIPSISSSCSEGQLLIDARCVDARDALVPIESVEQVYGESYTIPTAFQLILNPFSSAGCLIPQEDPMSILEGETYLQAVDFLESEETYRPFYFFNRETGQLDLFLMFKERSGSTYLEMNINTGRRTLAADYYEVGALDGNPYFIVQSFDVSCTRLREALEDESGQVFLRLDE